MKQYISSRDANHDVAAPSAYHGSSAPRVSVMQPTILTFSGYYFDFTNPHGSRFTIEDIAHALSNICRFGGHCREFFSVAQHCVMVSQIVPREHALAGLMHEGGEAFVGDMPSPLKKIFPEFRVLEKRIEAEVLRRAGLSPELPQEIKHADLVALATEQRDLMNRRDGELWTMLEGIQPLAETIVPMTPGQAREAFLDRYFELVDVLGRRVAA